MPRFIVSFLEKHLIKVAIEAETAEEAERKWRDGDYDVEKEDDTYGDEIEFLQATRERA